jgi:hypothetical protein
MLVRFFYVLCGGILASGLRMRNRPRADIIYKLDNSTTRKLSSTSIPMPPEQSGGDYYITVDLKPLSGSTYVSADVTVDTG